MKILIDMNLSPRWQMLLQAAGISAVHWSDLGSGGAPDTEIAAFAADNGFVILTCDLDFGAILAATNGGRPSVVQLRAADVSVEAIGSRVIAGLQRVESELETGALVTIDADRMRLRLLPLRYRESD